MPCKPLMVGTANHLILLTACECQRSLSLWSSQVPKKQWFQGVQKDLLLRFLANCNSQESCKLQKRWSGRRGSNPRRPAWESPRQLIIKDNGAHGDAYRSKEISNSSPFRLLMEWKWRGRKAMLSLRDSGRHRGLPPRRGVWIQRPGVEFNPRWIPISNIGQPPAPSTGTGGVENWLCRVSRPPAPSIGPWPRLE